MVKKYEYISEQYQKQQFIKFIKVLKRDERVQFENKESKWAEK